MSISSNHPIDKEGASYTDRQHIIEVSSFYRVHKMELKTPDKFHGGWRLVVAGVLETGQNSMLRVYALRYYLDNGLIGGGYSVCTPQT